MTEAERQSLALKDFVQSGKHAYQSYGVWWGLPDNVSGIRPRFYSDTPAGQATRFLVDGFASVADGGTILEIGTGGGRWLPALLASAARRIVCVDGIPEFQTATQATLDRDTLSRPATIEFVVSDDGTLPTIGRATVSWVWSFDTFVHFHDGLFRSYCRTVSEVLKTGGVFHLHFAHRYPGCDVDGECFKYWDTEALVAFLAGLHLQPTGPCVEFRGGFGSKLMLFKRLPDS